MNVLSVRTEWLSPGRLRRVAGRPAPPGPCPGSSPSPRDLPAAPVPTTQTLNKKVQSSPYPDLLFRGMDPDQAPDPDPCPFLILRY
jgi:hypothetical protein